MAAVERAEYMDNHLSAVMEDTIKKEEKISMKGVQMLEKSGRLPPWSPPPQKPKPKYSEVYGKPEFYQKQKHDPESTVSMWISKRMWSSNPGWFARDGPKMVGTQKSDYVWDQEEIDYMKEQGFLGKEQNRRRDELSQYVEAVARNKNILKGQS